MANHLATHVLVALLCTAMLAPPAVLAARSGPIKAGATSCLGRSPFESAPSTTLVPVPNGASPAVCVRYQFRCSKGDRSCTDAEAATGTFKWGYTALDEGTCEAMKPLSGTYKNVFCCSTNNCNKPDPTLDRTSVVSSALSCLAPAPADRPNALPTGKVAPMVAGGKDTVCGRWRAKCSQEDDVCTAADAKAGAWRWFYVPVKKKHVRR